jgi:hypothetical protein
MLNLDALSPEKKQKLDRYYERAKESVPWRYSFNLIDQKEYLASAVSKF